MCLSNQFGSLLFKFNFELHILILYYKYYDFLVLLVRFSFSQLQATLYVISNFHILFSYEFETLQYIKVVA